MSDLVKLSNWKRNFIFYVNWFFILFSFVKKPLCQYPLVSEKDITYSFELIFALHGNERWIGRMPVNKYGKELEIANVGSDALNGQ